ncbi:cell envelope-related transcriptional attenuator [cyanobacterium endosymbiont of Rhopalodia gibberula]|uniref:LCP family protein n=1 Tax=cyanobacterium endosymbiont of Rhopalodia gibberula TaxID=1763363 RepID=UPI000DC6D8B9|nr:LCP family protein [cyanobacterium endosymbiont of Rhopalodia gibberula]BBA79536.1 cell envelope-related transcriptional attenuator [cyanobacterium endosymbiont of Rhopalodia gibberula]
MSVKKTYPTSPTPGKQLSSKKPNAKKQRGNWLLIGLGLTAVSLVSAMAGAFLSISFSATPLRQSSLTPGQEKVFSRDSTIAYKNLRLPELSRPVNLLVLGTKVLSSEVNEKPKEDLGYHALVNSFKGLSDTMVLLRFDPSQDKLRLLSIPRDTQANIGRGIRKINEANYYGGAALAAEAVSTLLGGVPVDRYVRVNIQGVEKVIDALGGVNVYVPKNMKYTDHSQHLYIDLKQGKQHLDGERAIAFLRFRYDRYGDIGRVQRQQMLMRAVVEQALRPQTVLKMPEILSVIGTYIDTNLTVEELVALAGFAAQTRRSNVEMLMVPGGFSGDGKQKVSYWIPYPHKIREMVADYFDHGNYQDFENKNPTRLRIAIQDSVEDPKAVKAMVNYLRERGYGRVFVSDNWGEPLTTTRIVAQQGDDLGAASLKATLRVGEVLVESTGTLSSDITIILGRDWQQQYPSFESPTAENFLQTQHNN